MKPGIRVVRGPDWNNQEQDSGEGYLGTIIYVPKSGSDDKKVTVIWDSGRELRYRAGLQGKYDLRVFDTAPTGIYHPNVNCSNCQENGIKGMRWKCGDCKNYNLCSSCYMNDKHDLKHAFLRINSPDTSHFNVPPRANSTHARKIARGIFPNVEIMRGPHWKWKNDDGGESGVGYVKEIVTWGNTSYRGAVQVQWKADKSVKNYRVGAEGCVDVIYTSGTDMSSGGQYYDEHLPLVNVVDSVQIQLKIGDKVIVNLPLQKFKDLQANQISGGWDDGMEQCLKETGTIIGFLYDGKSVKVQYKNSRTWLVNSEALFRKHTFSTGDPVTIMEDYNVVKELQKGHGGWNDEMKPALGKNGRILRLDCDGDMRINVDGNNWMFNPTCIIPVDKTLGRKVPPLPPHTSEYISDESDSSDESSDDAYTVVSEDMADLYTDMLKERQDDKENAHVKLVDAAATGDLETVKTVIRQYPDKIDSIYKDKTGLQVACYEGHKDIAIFLVQHGANMNIQNSEGNSALHFAVEGKEIEIVKILADNKAIVNLVNVKNQSALHIAARNPSQVCKILIEKGADPSLMDSSKDTVMHYVVSRRDYPPALLKIILGSKKAKFAKENQDGVNVLQLAVFKNNRRAVEIILKYNNSCVNIPSSNGRTALHLAAAYDRVEIASTLITEGKADINIKDGRGQTPLMYAVNSGKLRLVELFIKFKCALNAQDSHGNTALHIVQQKQRSTMMLRKKMNNSNDTEILCCLLENGVDINIKNKNGKTAVDLATNETDKIFMNKLAKNVQSSLLTKTQKGVFLPSFWDDMGGDTVLRVKLDMSKGTSVQQELQAVHQSFYKTLPQARITSVERVQNKFKWEMYQVKKKELEYSYGIGFANELSLFHGTKPEIIEIIVAQNFDWRIAGSSTGAIFGKGAYFARDAKYSDSYAQADRGTGRKYMFLCKVLAGKLCQGRSEYVKPPAQDPQNPKLLFDCCVDNVYKPSIYCVFETSQFYPEYIIEYS